MTAVFFDLDDTLLETQALYDHAIEQAVNALMVRERGQGRLLNAGEAQAYEDAFKRRLNAIDSERYQTFKFSPERFPGSLLLAADEFATPPLDETERNAIWRTGHQVFVEEAKVRQRARETLRALGGQYDVYCVTQGDEGLQNHRLDASGLRMFFQDVFIVPEKSPEVYARLAHAVGQHPEQCCMIGDSLRSDVIPALKAGWKAMHLPKNNWHMERQGYALPEGADTLTDVEEAQTRFLGAYTEIEGLDMLKGELNALEGDRERQLKTVLRGIPAHALYGRDVHGATEAVLRAFSARHLHRDYLPQWEANNHRFYWTGGGYAITQALWLMLGGENSGLTLMTVDMPGNNRHYFLQGTVDHPVEGEKTIRIDPTAPQFAEVPYENATPASHSRMRIAARSQELYGQARQWLSQHPAELAV